jgi:hypothetical protein
MYLDRATEAHKRKETEQRLPVRGVIVMVKL